MAAPCLSAGHHVAFFGPTDSSPGPNFDNVSYSKIESIVLSDGKVAVVLDDGHTLGPESNVKLRILKPFETEV